jgi:predicted membrane metal-binding protein
MSTLAKKGFVLIIASIFLISFLLTTGCAASKKGYEDRMISILSEAKESLDNNYKELAKVALEKSSKQREQRKKGLIEKQIEVLEETRDKIESVSAPDDFFSGHSDIIEFLQLLIKSREATLKNIGRKASANSSKAKSDAFETFQSSGRAFSRASSELPFLEYELRDTFETVLQDIQMDLQQQSGFGPSSGPGSSMSPGRTVP